MKPSTRKRVLTYGIPVDLIILATGVGLLLPSIPALGLIAVYAVAVLLSSWKSGWRGGVTATVFGAVVLLALFGDRVATIELAWFAAAGLIISGGAAVAAAQRTRPVAEITGGAAAEP
jgi:glucose-6-phosphate-specific signal transduction histidine kinase